MISYIKEDKWKIVEEEFHEERNRISESLFSIGNGRMGQRANFEEDFSGDSLQGSYIAGIYFPDKTKVGWWKVGYPEYFAKVINSVNWIGIRLTINGHDVDIVRSKVYDFRRELNMKDGYLYRTFTIKLPSGEKIKVSSRRFLSIVRKDLGAIEYSVEALNFSGELSFMPYLDFDVENEDSNFEEKFWEEVEKEAFDQGGYVCARTKKLDFQVGAAMQFSIYKEGVKQALSLLASERKKFVGQQFNISIGEGEKVTLYKYAAILSNMYYKKENLKAQSLERLEEALKLGYDQLLQEHSNAWLRKWEKNDITIEGDIKAQQGIRFNIFQLLQTYTGEDSRLNIGPKGFTGEKYGGSTYWDTEAYCLPFYMSATGQEVGRNLLLYRYKHLQKAIKNAQKLGFENGAALYPMVTMNGEECHNEWEITFEEIHRNGAIAYAIYNYVNYTGDEDYIPEYGLEVLIAISRFWTQRSQFSNHKNRYVILGVTGPNEYENNVNNNWYTNYIARWCLQYTLDSIIRLRKADPGRLNEIFEKVDFLEQQETGNWQNIIEGMYLPEWEKAGIKLQQDGFLDKKLLDVGHIKPEEKPINQHWSWDRILRSCYIKQADVLQGFYFFESHFNKDELKRNYEFYEPMTVHESSLSPCIHSILASSLGNTDKAYQMYLRTARLDLDDYNNEADEGCHITSMAGTWLSIVEGFGGKRVVDGKLVFNPLLPREWVAYSFRIMFRKTSLELKVAEDQIIVRHLKGPAVGLSIYDKAFTISQGETKEIAALVKNNVKI